MPASATATPSASLMLVRDAPHFEVLMVRRHHEIEFASGGAMLSRRGWLAVVAAAAAVTGCGGPVYSYRYRLTLEVDTPEGLKSGLERDRDHRPGQHTILGSA